MVAVARAGWMSVFLAEQVPQGAVQWLVEEVGGEVGRVVAGLDRQRVAVDAAQPLQRVHGRAGRQPERIGDQWGGRLRFSPEHLGARPASGARDLVGEAAEAQRQTRLGDERAAWGPAVDRALPLEHDEGLAGGHATHPEVTAELPLGGHQRMRGELARLDAVTQCGGDAQVGRGRSGVQRCRKSWLTT